MDKRLVLLVEDEPHIAHLLERRLHSIDCDVVIVHTGDAALHLLNEMDPQLVLMDALLPDKDGYAVLREIRRRGSKAHKLHHVPVIMQSAQCPPVNELEGLEEITAFIQKPYDMGALMGAIRNVFGEETS